MLVRRLAVPALAGAALTAGLTVSIGQAAAGADPTTYTVGNPATCANSDFRTISAAVAVAQTGDTIKVCPGTYGEHVDITTPGLTLLGGQAGVDARGRRVKSQATIVSFTSGAFTIEQSADDTTIDGFQIQGASSNNSDGVADFAGASGLTLVNNLIQLNGNGINLQNPDSGKPALISQNSFVNNNAGGDPGNNGNTGTGIFISNGPANNTQIVDNAFKSHSQTAINFAGDANQPSAGLVVSDNRSVNDATFVVATHSAGAVIDANNVSTSDSVPGGGHGTGILDFGANTALHITNNIMKATGTSESSGISVSNYAGSSQYTDLVGNSVNGWFNDVKVVSGNTTAYVNHNKLLNAQNDGIVVQSDVSGVVLSHNTVSGAAQFACEDDTTGSGTAGTANTWLKNSGNSASSPAGICADTSAT